MKITVEPLPYGYVAPCVSQECRRLPEFIGRLVYSHGYIAAGDYILFGTICAKIEAPYGRDPFYWCRDCIDREYQKIKIVLDSNLWAFR